MEINWVVVGWIIDMILNGVAWLIIAAVSLPLIDIADKLQKNISIIITHPIFERAYHS